MASKRQTNETRYKHLVRRLWRAIGVFFGVMFLWFAILWFFAIPSFRKLEDPSMNLASTIFGSDGTTIIGTYYLENRVPVKYEDLSPFLIQALLATEDKRYYSHSGVDGEALFRVAVKTVTMRKESSGGGSTITQQLAKLLFKRPELEKMNPLTKTFVLVNTKFKEWLTAIKLERSYTKEEIIAMYLNQVDFLYDAYGIQSASRTYFDKAPKELKVEEAAMLVGMLKNPALYNPRLNKKAAMGRRETVLKCMQQKGCFGENNKRAQFVYDSLRVLPIDVSKFHRLDHNEGLAPHFREYLRQDLKRLLKDHPKTDGSDWDIYKDGLKIYTTIDPIMQRHAEEAVREHLTKHQKLFFEHWKDQDPWTKKSSTSTEVPVEARVASLNRLIWESDRYVTVRKQYMPLSDKLELRDIDVERMHTIDKKNTEKAGSGDEQLNNWLKTGFITQELGNKYRQVMSSADWFKIIQEREAISEYMKKPVPMKVFAWNEKNEKDTIMSPFDSIRYHRMILQTGVMAVDPHNGYVKVWVGGVNHKYFKVDHVNTGTRRQVGSTIKPLLYATAFSTLGYSPCFLVQDVAWTINPGEGEFGLLSPWTAHNADGGYSGNTIPLKQALRLSKNSISEYIMKSMKSTRDFRMLLGNVGIDTSVVPSSPSICLGSPDLSVFEMTGAYSTFANQGNFVKPVYVTRIEDRHGNIIYEYTPEFHKALNESVTYAMTYMLKYVAAGSGSFGGIRSHVGGKTGTTQDQSDAWYMGVSPNLVVGTWVGCDDRFVRFRSLALGQGATSARPIFQNFMRKIEADPKLKFNTFVDFVKPDGAVIETDCDNYTKQENEYGTPETIIEEPTDDGGQWGDQYNNPAKPDKKKPPKTK